MLRGFLLMSRWPVVNFHPTWPRFYFFSPTFSCVFLHKIIWNQKINVFLTRYLSTLVWFSGIQFSYAKYEKYEITRPVLGLSTNLPRIQEILKTSLIGLARVCTTLVGTIRRIFLINTLWTWFLMIFFPLMSGWFAVNFHSHLSQI